MRRVKYGPWGGGVSLVWKSIEGVCGMGECAFVHGMGECMHGMGECVHGIRMGECVLKEKYTATV